MIRGINPDESVPYVPKCDRDAKPDEQTVFWIRPKNTIKANETARRYLQVQREGKKGETILDEKRANEADIKEFVSTVERVDNYIYSTQFPQYRNDDSTDKIHKNITDRIMLECIAHDIPSDLFLELIAASRDLSALSEGEKKS